MQLFSQRPHRVQSAAKHLSIREEEQWVSSSENTQLVKNMVNIFENDRTHLSKCVNLDLSWFPEMLKHI